MLFIDGVMPSNDWHLFNAAWNGGVPVGVGFAVLYRLLHRVVPVLNMVLSHWNCRMPLGILLIACLIAQSYKKNWSMDGLF